MKILIFGAGVIGGIYGAKLFQNGFDVTLFARGNNFQQIKDNGLTLTNMLTGKKTKCSIPVIGEVNSSHKFDLIIVATRLEQLKESIPTIKGFYTSQNILFMVNNPEELGRIESYFPNKNIFLGFPGVGGTKTNNSIEFIQIKQQKTTIGNAETHNLHFLEQIKTIFIKSGFSTVVEPKMKDWLIVHSIFISCASASIIKENGSSEQLGNNKKSVIEMVKSIKEGFKACEEQDIAIVPKNINIIFLKMPEWFSVLYWQKAMKGNTGKLAIEPHAREATDEMKMLANQVLEIIHKSKIKTPRINKLLGDFIKK